jgi:hypothetical protein
MTVAQTFGKYCSKYLAKSSRMYQEMVCICSRCDFKFAFFASGSNGSSPVGGMGGAYIWKAVPACSMRRIQGSVTSNQRGIMRGSTGWS